MIYIEDVKVNFDKPIDEHKFFAEAYKKFKKEANFPMNIVWADRKVTQNIDNPGKKILPSGSPLPTANTILYKETEYVVRYCESVNTKIQNNVKKMVYGPHRIPFNGSIQIKENEADLAFFLIHCLPYYQNDSDIDFSSVFSLKESKNSIYKIDDEAVNAKKRRNERELRTLIENTILGMPEEKLIELAKSNSDNFKVNVGVKASASSNKTREILQEDVIKAIMSMKMPRVSILEEINKIWELKEEESGSDSNELEKLRAQLKKEQEAKQTAEQKLSEAQSTEAENKKLQDEIKQLRANLEQPKTAAASGAKKS